jgi:hypothetical protein
LKECTTPDFRNIPSTTHLEGEEIMDATGKDGNASMLEQVKRPNPWRKMMVIYSYCIQEYTFHSAINHFTSTFFKH